jgi:hypothetical protein
MRTPPLARSAALLILALSLHGCGSDSSTNPNNGSMNQSTADDFALQTVTSLSVVGADLQVAVGSTPSSAARSMRAPGDLARPSRALWDTSFVQAGVTFEASRTFYDASDNPLAGYGPTATWLRWTSRATGTYEGPRDTATVGHASNIDVHGIESGQDTLKFDGGCGDTLENRFRSYDNTRMSYFYWTSGTTIANVRFLKSLIQLGYPTPISGRVTILVSADRLRSNNRVDVEAHFDATIIVTFNGPGTAVINVNGSYYYYWNLATNQVTRV